MRLATWAVLVVMTGCSAGELGSSNGTGKTWAFLTREVTLEPEVGIAAHLAADPPGSGAEIAPAAGTTSLGSPLTVSITQDRPGDALVLGISGGPIGAPATLRARREGSVFTAIGTLEVDLTPLRGEPETDRLCQEDLTVVTSPARIDVLLAPGSITDLSAADAVSMTLHVVVPAR